MMPCESLLTSLLLPLLKDDDVALEQSLTIATDFLVSAEDAPEWFEKSLVKFVNEKNIESLAEVGKGVLERHLFEDYGYSAHIVAGLVLKGRLSQEDAALILTSFPRAKLRQLDDVRRAADVAEAVLHDKEDGIVGIEEDHLFLDALRKL